MSDAIADMLIRIKNAGMAGNSTTTIPYSNLKFEIVNVLLDKGFIKSFSVKGKKIRKHIEVEVAYGKGSNPKIEEIFRTSKPSRRIYKGVRDIKPVKGGLGVMVLSTPKGVMDGDKAKKEKVGGEVLFEIW